MAFPNLLYGPESERFNSYTSQRYPLGTMLQLPDGRMFRFGKKGTGAAIAGKLYQSEVPDGNFDTQAVPASSLNVVGSRDLRATLSANAITANLWAEGYAITEAVAGSGEGYAYKIESHPASAGSEDVTFHLAAGNGLQKALGTSDKVTFIKNPYKDVIVHPAPPTAAVIGIAASPIAASSYGWFQVRGLCACLIAGTVVIGGTIVPTGTVTGTPDGSVEAAGTIITDTNPTIAQYTEIVPIGICVEVAPDTGFGSVLLKMA